MLFACESIYRRMLSLFIYYNRVFVILMWVKEWKAEWRKRRLGMGKVQMKKKNKKHYAFCRFIVFELPMLLKSRETEGRA